MPGHRLSRAAYRCLLRTYPREFRERFTDDLQADFAEMIEARGRAHAWRRVVADLFSAVPLTAADAMAERERTAHIVGPIGPINPHGETKMRSLLYDLRQALRSLMKAPAFTLVTVLTLALGIGANSAIFSLVNAALLRPLGYPDAHRLMMIHEGIPQAGIPRFEVSPPDYLDLVAQQQSFSAIGAYRTRTQELSGSGEPEQVNGAEVTASVFGVLGVQAAQGRTFAPDEDQRQAGVAVISHDLWMRRFSGGAALGQPLVLDRRPYTIVGVMPASFEFPRRGPAINSLPADVWLPLVFNPFERQARGMMYNHSVVARLREGVSPEQAAADTTALSSRIHANYPADVQKILTLKISATTLVDELTGHLRRPLFFLLAAVGLVLLVACANVANLILSRSVARQREIGVRAALGAGRLRLFQVLLSEGIILAATGAALGLALAFWALQAVPSALAAGLPAAHSVPIDWRVVAFTSVLAAGSAALFALVPLTAGLRRDLNDLLREGSGRATGGRRQHHIQGALVVTSVAFAFVLLAGAGLLVRSFNRLVAAPSGVQTASVLTMQVRLPVTAYGSGPLVRTFYRGLDERLRTLPGVRAVAIASDLPLDPDGERRVFTAENSALGVSATVAVTWVHGDYFGTFGVPLLRGRSFSSDEQRENRRVAIVSRRIAESNWPGEDPIGRRLKWGPANSPAPWHTVIGMAGDVVEGTPGTEPVIHAYVPYTELPDAALGSPIASGLRRLVIAVNGDGDARGLAGSARAAIAALDPALPVSEVQTIAQLEHDRSAPQRFSALVVSGFGAVALLLAAIGLYGVLAFVVSQRRREIGVRLALGSTPNHVVGLILRKGMALVGVGLFTGAIAAFSVAQLLKTVLFETAAYDPLTFVSVPLVLIVVTLVASLLPARRAAGVDPMISLRNE
jgi:putative ABC transport system permease protein